MKKTIQTKRSQSSKSNFRALYAKTGRQRRVKAATTADAHTDLESDIPNVGLGRALLVILLLHVVAIGAIYTHITFFGDQSGADTAQESSKVVVTSSQPVEPAAPIVPPQVTAPVVVPDTSELLSERYIVVTGDTYSRIAKVRNVDLTALRALNDDRPLRAGVVLDLPAELSSRPVAVSATPAVAPPIVQIPRAIVEPEDTAPVAIVVKPSLNRSEALKTISTIRDSGQRYTVKSGDTLWRISKRYAVSREKLLKLNGITDANNLQIGFKLKIPNQ